MKAMRKVHEEEIERLRANHQRAISALLSKLSSLETDHTSHRTTLLTKLGQVEDEHKTMADRMKAPATVHVSVGCDFTTCEVQGEAAKGSQERLIRVSSEATVRRLENELRLMKQKLAKDAAKAEEAEDRWMGKACPRCPALEKDLFSKDIFITELESKINEMEENDKEKRKKASAILEMVHEQDSYIRDITQKKHYRAGAGGTTGVNV